MGIGNLTIPRIAMSLWYFAISEWQAPRRHPCESESLSPPRALLAIFVDLRVALRQCLQGIYKDSCLELGTIPPLTSRGYWKQPDLRLNQGLARSPRTGDIEEVLRLSV